MTNRIAELEAKKALIVERRKEEYKALEAMAIKVVERYLDAVEGAEIKWLNIRCYASVETEISCEIGFRDGDKFDFGSDFNLYYNAKPHRVSINYGTIGNFTKDNVAQYKRIALLYHLTQNVNDIEEGFQTIANNTGIFQSLEEREWEIENEIREIKKQISNEKLNALIEATKEGDVFKYVEHSSVQYRSIPVYGDTPFTIKKITPKRIRVSVNGYFREHLVDKETFFRIYNNGAITKIS